MSAALEFGFRAEPGETYCSGGIPGYVRATNVTQEGRDPRGECKVWMRTVALFQDANETPNVQVQAGVAAFFLPPFEGSGHPQTGSDVVSFLNILKAEFIIFGNFFHMVVIPRGNSSVFGFLFPGPPFPCLPCLISIFLICIFLLLENNSGSFAIHNLKLSLCWVWEERLAGSR